MGGTGGDHLVLRASLARFRADLARMRHEAAGRASHFEAEMAEASSHLRKAF